MQKYDVIIIGAGPAGLTAAIYAGRRALKALVLSMDVGGQTAETDGVENYPGFDEIICGTELSQKMLKQAKKFGAEFLVDQEVQQISKASDTYNVKTNSGQYESGALILAFGKKPRELNVPGEEKFRGKGVSYCANCDGPLFKGKTVAVIGGGNSAIDAALYLSKIAAKVYLVHRRDAFRGDEVLVERLKQAGAEFVLDSTVEEILGSDTVEKIKVKNVKTNDAKEIEVSGVFVEVGFEVNVGLAKDLVKTDQAGQILIDLDGRTSDSGIFAAGDLTQTPYKQIVIAAGQGAIAALSAYDYIQKKSGKPTVKVDWGKEK